MADAVRAQTDQLFLNDFDLPLNPLLPFEGNLTNDDQEGLIFHLTDYLELVDFTGRAIHPTKRGSIPQHHSPILERPGMETADWLDLATGFEKHYQSRHSRRAHLKKGA